MTLRPICDIATDIIRDMQASQTAARPARARYYAAWPYLQAMRCLRTTDDTFGYESGISIVLYGLSNLPAYRGEKAKALKAELKSHTVRKGA